MRHGNKLTLELGALGLRVWSQGGGQRIGVMGLGSGGLELGSRGCSWFEITVKVLQLIYKYPVVSCAVFNYLVVGLKGSY